MSGAAALCALYAEFTALPGKAEEVAALLRGLTEEVRREPGNVTFAAHQKVTDPASFFVYEEYLDERAFQQHISADYGARFNASLEPLILEDHSSLTWLRRLQESANGH